MFEKYAPRDTKSNTCSINAGCVAWGVVQNEHVFDRTHVRSPELGEFQGKAHGMKGSEMTSPIRTSSTPRTARDPRISSGARSATRAPDVRRSRRTVDPRAQQPASVRLTRRGRLVAFTASVAALGAVIVGAGQVAGASAQAGSDEPSVVVVQAGETLWGIAQEVAPGSDPRGVVHQIRRMNDLGTAPIVPGQSIVVPVAG